MATNRQNNLYYDGYDPTWIIGTGKPAPVYPSRTNFSAGRTMAAPVPAGNGLLVPPEMKLPHGPAQHPYKQGLGVQPHGVHGTATHAQSHGQKIGKSLLGPMAHSHITDGRLKSALPFPPLQGVPISNPNPYLRPPPVQRPLPSVQLNQAFPSVPDVQAQRPLVPAPALVVPSKGSGPTHISGPGLPDVHVQAVIKVVMWVPLCCEACEGRWKDELTDLPGFQGYDVEKKLERVTVFGHVSPSSVLATMQKVVPRARMWRH